MDCVGIVDGTPIIFSLRPAIDGGYILGPSFLSGKKCGAS
jgi:hypothetical protein